MAELSEVNLTRGETQHAAQNSDRWRRIKILRSILKETLFPKFFYVVLIISLSFLSTEIAG